ncbi:CLUMA_CG013208, isoform A [Clunio marinus]|uniref:CLUMA_CG013208, isoform A n=1 Tax=Clunio marinus TaxID=568069 RepID=A0A1J1IN51_9DIPT|nr:CLUMA_CG013208, isoform A [Clunio marinus]
MINVFAPESLIRLPDTVEICLLRRSRCSQQKLSLKNDVVKNRVSSDINLNFQYLKVNGIQNTLTVCAVIFDLELIVSNDLNIFRDCFKKRRN